MNQVGSFVSDTSQQDQDPTSAGNTHTLKNPLLNKYTWILDSGATNHVCFTLSDFSTYHRINPILIKLPNGHYVTSNYSGTVNLNYRISLTNVLYVSAFSFNLVSISKLTSFLKSDLTLCSNKCIIQDSRTRDRIGSVALIGGLYCLDRSITQHVSPFLNCVTKTVGLWHKKLGHPSDEKLKILQTYYLDISVERSYFCDACHQAKQKKLPFSLNTTHSAHIFDLIHMDIWGPCSIISMHGHRYFITIIDDFSHFTWIFSMQNKSEVRANVVSFISYVENHFQTKIKSIRTGNGVEFVMKEFFASKGILHQASCIETPEQNGIVERKHQHILNVTRSLPFSV